MKHYSQQDYHRTLDRVFDRYSGKPAMVNCINEHEQRKYSYRKLKKMTEHIKCVLERQNIRKGERVAVLARPSADMAVTLLALAYLGYTAVIPDVSLPKEEQERLLDLTMPSAVIVNEEFFGNIGNSLKTTVPVFRQITGQSPMIRLNKGLNLQRKPQLAGKKDVIAILFSSGTTGNVKGVEVTYQSVFYAQKAGAVYGRYCDSSPHFLHILPLSHVAGFMMLHINLILGAEMGFVPELTAAGLTLGLQVYKPTHMVMIPKVYETIHKKIKAEIAKKSLPVRAAFSVCKGVSSYVRRHTGIKMRWLTKPFYAPAFGDRIKVMGCGAAPCDIDTIHFFLDLGLDFLNVYGSTEASFPISASSLREKYPDRGVGNVKQFPFIDVRIEDEEILVRSALLMNGYFRDPESTCNAFTPDGYLKTGDLGYIDNDGYLYIKGRRKETVQLSNGNKVSAPDVDKYYQEMCGDIRVASCGVADDYMNTEHLVLFVESGNIPPKKAEELKEKLQKRSAESSLYRVADIMFIPEIPQTSLGKIQRFKLSKIAKENSCRNNTEGNSHEIQVIARPSVKVQSNSIIGSVCEILSKYVTDDVDITPDSQLSDDLCIDSVTMFEVCSELQTEYDIDLMERIGNVVTVKDLADIVSNSDSASVNSVKSSSTDVRRYPLARRGSDILILKALMMLSQKLYNIETVGAENISPDGHYIFCPNHESHLDGLWVFTALKGHLECLRMACLAKQEHLDHRISRTMIRMLGGIPTDRSGNPAPALEQAMKVLKKSDTQFLVHPEGTRTRNGKMGVFKKGVASLSIDTGVPLVPVFIKGAYQIYPADRALPKLYDFGAHKRYTLKIVFGKPIFPQEDDTPETLTAKLRKAVEALRCHNEAAVR